MPNQEVEMFLAEMVSVQEEIRKLAEHQNPDVMVSVRTMPVTVLAPGNIIRVYFEAQGTRVIADSVVVSYDLTASGAVLMGINEDPVLFNTGSGIGSGMQLFGSSFTSGAPVPSLVTIRAPIEFLGFVLASSAVHVGINTNAQNPASDAGYISVRGWVSQRAARHPGSN